MGLNLNDLSGLYNDLSGLLEYCADYCRNSINCNAVKAEQNDKVGFRKWDCWFNYDGFEYNYSQFQCYGSTCNDNYSYNDFMSNKMAVFKDYYEEHYQYLPKQTPDGTIGGADEEAEGICDETSTGFGNVNYLDMEGYAFSSVDDKNVIRESGTNCAARCFELAGCSAFYAIDNSCTFIIGYVLSGEKTTGVTEAGKINALCPNTAFKNTFILRSRFYCLFFSPSQAGSIADEIVTSNTGNRNTPLRVWKFATESNIPLITSSQYVSVEMSSTTSISTNDGRYRSVTFAIETHVRLGNEWTRKRRQADDILADIKAIEQQATSFILDGDMDLPDDVEVAATSPVETVEFVQTASDSSVVADCSSGSCICSAGFIDNGDGCEEMTEEQADTTQSPTTTQAPADPIADSLQSLVDKMKEVFEDNRPDRPRTKLLAKWDKLRHNTVQRYNQMKNNGCQYTTTWSIDNIDFDNINACNVSFFSNCCHSEVI